MIVEETVKECRKNLENTLGSIKFHKDTKKIYNVDIKIVDNFIDSFEEACKLHIKEMRKELLND